MVRSNPASKGIAQQVTQEQREEITALRIGEAEEESKNALFQKLSNQYCIQIVIHPGVPDNMWIVGNATGGEVASGYGFPEPDAIANMPSVTRMLVSPRMLVQILQEVKRRG